MDEVRTNPATEDAAYSPETPEDVAVLYTWANVHGGKYRDFSASRREYRAQQRHRMVEAQRQAELEAARAREDAAALELEQARLAEQEAAKLHDAALQQEAEAARRAAEEHAEQQRLEAQRHVETAEELKRAMEEAQREMEEARVRAEEQAARYAEADRLWRESQIGKQQVPGAVEDPYYFAGHLEPTQFAPGKGVRSSVAQRVSSESRIAASYYRSREQAAEDAELRRMRELDSGYYFFPREAFPSVDRQKPEHVAVSNDSPADAYQDRMPLLGEPWARMNSTESDLHIPPRPHQVRMESGVRKTAPLTEETVPDARRRRESAMDLSTRTERRPRFSEPSPNVDPADLDERALSLASEFIDGERRTFRSEFEGKSAPRETRDASPEWLVRNRAAEDAAREQMHAEARDAAQQRLDPQRQADAERIAEEQRRSDEMRAVDDRLRQEAEAMAAERRRLDEERQRKDEERRRAEEQRRQHEERLRAEEQGRAEEERRAVAEAQRRTEERRIEEERRMVEERRAQERAQAEAKRAEDERRAEDDRRRAAEAREAEERRIADAKAAAAKAEAQREAERQRRAEERRREDERRKADETLRAQERRRAEEAERERRAQRASDADRPARDSQVVRAADGGINLRPLPEHPPMNTMPPQRVRSVTPSVTTSSNSGARRAVITETNRAVEGAVKPVAEETRAAAPAAEAAPVVSAVPPAVNAVAPVRVSTSAGDTLQQSRERVAARWFALKGLMNGGGEAQAEQPAPAARAKDQATPCLAIVSLSGGTGKTSLVATLGRALSSVGEKVLLADTSQHGFLPYYFGARELRPDVVRTFSPPPGSPDAPVYMVNYETDRLHGDEARQMQLVDEMMRHARGTGRILLDLNGSSAWLARLLTRSNSNILVPIAPDMNSVLSIQSVDRFFSGAVDGQGRPVAPHYVLNQFDASLPLHLDVREVLRQQLGNRLLPVMIRRSPSVSEALAEGMTVIDYAPDSPVTDDYKHLADWVRNLAAPATTGMRGIRWSEQ